MVYCKLISVNENIAKYSIGGRVNDMTGVLVYDRKDDSFEIEKESDESTVYKAHFKNMVCKYIEEFRKGIIKDKIGYEI